MRAVKPCTQACTPNSSCEGTYSSKPVANEHASTKSKARRLPCTCSSSEGAAKLASLDTCDHPRKACLSSHPWLTRVHAYRSRPAPISRTIGRSAGSLSLSRDVSAWNWSQPKSHHRRACQISRSAYWSRSAKALEALSSLDEGLVSHGNLKAFNRNWYDLYLTE